MSQNYLFSPIKDVPELLKAIEYVHFSCYELCKNSLQEFPPNAGNMGIFCHYDDEYRALIKIREALTEPSSNPDQKYYKLVQPIVIDVKNDVPKTTYTHLYIRKPDPYRHHVGDVDFFLEPLAYEKLKRSLHEGKIIPNARIFDRTDLDMIELYHPDIDALAYISTEKMSTDVRIKISTKNT